VTSAHPSIAIHVDHVMFGRAPPSKGGGAVSKMYEERRMYAVHTALHCRACIRFSSFSKTNGSKVIPHKWVIFLFALLPNRIYSIRNLLGT
jgi:hypothetical protein